MEVDDMQRALAFWTRALEYAPRDDYEDTWNVLVPRAGFGVQLALDLNESPIQEVPHLHLDLYAGDVAEQAAQVERLVSLGGQHVDWKLYPEDPDFVVLADPEGNRFCLVDTGRG
jgi:catechol 2,3-dioxygenase-like lactoylglutathione lyase family enzyme